MPVRNNVVVAIPDNVRRLLAEAQAIHLAPVTDAALVERMRTEATTWTNAVHMQKQRVIYPLIDPESPGNEVWRQEADLHFLLVALTRLRRAVTVVTRVVDVQQEVADLVLRFDAAVPSLIPMRNVAEHVDDYTLGTGRRQSIHRSQIQVWSLGDDDGDLVWRWLGFEFSVSGAHAAAVVLYRDFLAIASAYLARS